MNESHNCKANAQRGRVSPAEGDENRMGGDEHKQTISNQKQEAKESVSGIKQRTKRGAAYPAMEGRVSKITACGTHGKKGTSSAKVTPKVLQLETEGEHTHTHK